MEEEIWRPIDGYEGRYEVSSIGRIKSLSRKSWNGHGIMILRERILAPGINSRGYETVNLYINGKRNNVLVHQIVAKTFIPNPEGKPCIDHINTNRRDNHIKNLRWCTQAENCNNILSRKKISEANRGEKHPMWGKRGADNPFSHPVSQFTKDGVYIKTFPSVLDAAKEINAGRHLIYRVLCGARKSCRGFMWRYESKR